MISIVTPAHAACSPYLVEAHTSLKEQTLQDWEWLVLTNHGGKFKSNDKRVRVVEAPAAMKGIGALKHFATGLAKGSHIVEFDGDDVLMPTALERVAEAFAGGADMVYSDFAEFHDKTWRPNVYSGVWGWACYPVHAPNGAPLSAMRAPACTPQNVRSVQWAPNHVRAFTREAALRRRPDLFVGDDQALFLDLFCGGAKIVHVPECLYLYRVHPHNTVKRENANIQVVDGELYYTHAERLALMVEGAHVDLCGGINTRPGWDPADLTTGVDLDEVWPYPDSSVGAFRASDALEHLRDPIHVMNEAYRCLAPGGMFLTHTPSTEGLGAWCDPTHVSFWNALTWRYYTDPAFARYIPRYTGRFALARAPRRLDYGEGLIYTEAHLIALKDGYTHMGEDKWRK